MPIKPTVEGALFRLRIDEDLRGDVEEAIEQAFSQAQTYLDRPLFASKQEAVDSGIPRAMVCTPDIIAAQLLLVDALVGANSVKDQADKRDAAFDMLFPHRYTGV